MILSSSPWYLLDTILHKVLICAGKITIINGIQTYNWAHIDVSGNEPIRITGLLFLGFQILSGLALERISEKNPDDEEKDGGWINSVDGLFAPSCIACSSAAIFLSVPAVLPQGQTLIFLKHCLWKIDPHEPHFVASSSWYYDKTNFLKDEDKAA